MRYVLSLICALALPNVAAAQSFQSVNRLSVVSLGGSDFEVIEARGEGARGMWCAAADYALNRGAERRQRLYVKTPRGPSISGAGRTSATFTTDAASLGVPTQQSYSVSVRIAGLGLPLHHAYEFCKDYQIELEDVVLRRWKD